MSATATAELGFEVSDVTGQKVVAVSNVGEEVTVTELIRGLLDRMQLPANDAAGRPVSYHARLDRIGAHLPGAQRVRELLVPGDKIVLQPNVDAGTTKTRRHEGTKPRRLEGTTTRCAGVGGDA